MMVLAMMVSVSANAKTKSVTKKLTIDRTVSKLCSRKPSALMKARKVRVKSSKKAVVIGRYWKKGKNRKIVFTPKKKGSAVITVTCYLKKGKKKVYRYKIKVTESRKMTDLEKSKKAFEIQNQYRLDKGVEKLEWSDEIYEFCLYRMKTSGYDSHKNIARDKNAYFGGFAAYRNLLFGENMAGYTSSPKEAMEMWKKSSGHYRNLLDSEHVCGAIATYKGMWIAIFMDEDADILRNWRTFSLKAVTVKRYDSLSATYLSGSSFGYYEETNRDSSLKSTRIRDINGETVYLEVGKTYVFYEKLPPTGYTKANAVTITVKEDGINEVVLKN